MRTFRGVCDATNKPYFLFWICGFLARKNNFKAFCTKHYNSSIGSLQRIHSGTRDLESDAGR